MSEWKHKDEWTKRGEKFLVKVSRHSSEQYDLVDNKFKETGRFEHKWCLYAFIYPGHLQFSKFDGNSMWQEASGFFDWHCGCSYLEYHRDNESRIVSVQVGCDYSHLYDDCYLNMATKEDAISVFRDADNLFETLTRIGSSNEVAE